MHTFVIGHEKTHSNKQVERSTAHSMYICLTLIPGKLKSPSTCSILCLICRSVGSAATACLKTMPATAPVSTAFTAASDSSTPSAAAEALTSASSGDDGCAVAAAASSCWGRSRPRTSRRTRSLWIYSSSMRKYSTHMTGSCLHMRRP